MPTAERAKLQYEAGQTPYAIDALTDSGDAKVFEGASAPWSKASGFAPVIRPDGLLTGGVITPAAAAGDDDVDVAAGSAYINGQSITWSADTDVQLTRATPTDTHIINSITITSAGAVAVVAGTDGTAFSETRGADGGPPLIPTTSIEIGQVRLASNAAAAVTDDEIFDTVGIHKERSDYPIYDVDYVNGTVTFVSALPLIHTASVPKEVHASYAVPVFADVAKSSDFVPPERSFSVNSKQIYARTLGSTTQTLNAGSFVAYLEDGVTDGLVGLVGEELWFKFFPDQYKSPYVLSQGKLGITRTFPAGDYIKAQCTINAEEEAGNFGA